MKLKLHHCPNPDIAGGYYETPVDPAEITLTVGDISDASLDYRLWIERNRLGAGNCAIDSGMLCFDGETKPFARVSYNGNVWGIVDGNKLYDTKTQLAETNCAPPDWKWA